MRTVSFGIVDRRAVFMDVRTDSYFTLDPAGEDHLHRLLELGGPLSCDSELLGKLGIDDESAEVIAAVCPAPSRSLLDEGELPRAGLRQIVALGMLVRTIRSRVRTQPIETVLKHMLASRRSSPAGHLRRSQMTARAGRFLSARRLVPIKANCLVDSLSLLRWLGDQRSGAALVFGAKLDPFAAHCWVQAGDLAVNERLETLAAFTPVRVIRCSEVTL